MPGIRTPLVISCTVILASVSLIGQDPRPVSVPGLRLGPFSRTAVLDAPFSAVASTVVIKRNRDGTRERLTATTRVYRDSSGRVRLDYEVPAATRGQALAGKGMRKMAILKLADGPDSDGHPHVYNLDSASRTFRALGGVSPGTLFNAETQFAIPTGLTPRGAPKFATFVTADVHATDGGERESLGSAHVEGLEVIGWRATGVKPVFCKDCDTLAGMKTDERWESPDLRVVVIARHRDQGDALPVEYTGKGVDIDYRLTNIVRAEPPADLFTVPPDYVRHWGGPGDPDVSLGGPWPADVASPAGGRR